MDLLGREVAKSLDHNLKGRIESLNKRGIIPKLAVMRIGNREEDISYEKGLKRKFDILGIQNEVFEYPVDIPREMFLSEVERLNNEVSIHGILIFRPLPKHIDEDEVKDTIKPSKDVDCFSGRNLAKVFAGEDNGFSPCTAQAVIEILKHYQVATKGSNIVILGRSLVIGKPAAMLLLKEDATVTICHSKSKDLPSFTRQANIIVAAIGKARFLKKDHVKEGSIVIDVGINVDEAGNLCGDADYNDLKDWASAITPVPGGVGGVTTSVLAKHVVMAAEQNT
jgi:methylenetetrahydrofolate dehydrogenase (NADP+)/methenyltetrahydrofolate cyclohydrolase